MDKVRSLAVYYAKGLELTNKSLDIYLITFILSISTFLPSLFPHSLYSAIFSCVSFVLMILNLGFTLSIPLFLVHKQQKKSSDFQDMLSITIQNTKKIIVPVFILLVLFVIIVVALFLLGIMIFHPTSEQIIQFFQGLNYPKNGWYLVSLTLPIIFSFFIFTSFLFSLKHKGLISSLNGSFKLSFRHLYYVSIVMLLGIISGIATSFLPNTEIWGLLLKTGIGLYISLVITASTLFYYQKTMSAD